MDSRKIVFRETTAVAIGEVVCVAAMLGVFALVGNFDRKVLLGGILGGILTVLNFLFMAVGASLAADKAEAQDVKGGQGLIRMSYLLRTVILFAVMFACVKSGLCNVFSLVLPLVFLRPILTVGEFLRKKGDPNI